MPGQSPEIGDVPVLREGEGQLLPCIVAGTSYHSGVGRLYLELCSTPFCTLPHCCYLVVQQIYDSRILSTLEQIVSPRDGAATVET